MNNHLLLLHKMKPIINMVFLGSQLMVKLFCSRIPTMGLRSILLELIMFKKESSQLVKKAELCEKRAMAMNKQPDDDTWYKLFRKSMIAPSGFCVKIYIFMVNCRRHRLHAYGIFPGLECMGAIEDLL